jgi:hypothetical protein
MDRMKHTRVWAWVMAPVLVLGVMTAFSATRSPARADGVTRQIASSGTATIRDLPTGSGAIQFPEFAGEPREEEGADTAGAAAVNRSLSNGTPGAGLAVTSGRSKSNPQLITSFDGMNHRDQRTANGGNQFSIEPPDQGMCAGNGFVLESLNDVLRVYDRSGNALVGVTDLNTFYGYPAAINRTTGISGQFVTDPSCYFDPDTQRWFNVVLTLEVNPLNGAFLGPNHLDIAVSRTSDPTGSWTIYRIPVQDDGTEGTPDHDCAGGPCLGDFPHIGADRNGFYITTNEYPFFGDGFHAAQVYALSKPALASGAATVSVTQIDTIGAVGGNPGFTVWPATTPAGGYANDLGGTEYFLSSMAGEEANGNGTDNRLALWALSNTSSLNSASPAINLRNTIVPVSTYSEPPKADQKPGDIPLGECVNDTTTPTPAGPGCWRLLLAAEPAHNEVESHLDASDTRMQQVVFANGKVWGALGTAVQVGGQTKAGVAFYVVSPKISAGSLGASLIKQGQFGMAGNNLTYPNVGVTASGRGVITFTLVGADHYPSAAFAGLDASAGAGPVHVAQEGLGPSDGFSSYKAFVGNPPRTRWGDYGATAVDGNNIWIASEYIAQTCTLTEWLTPPIGGCGNTRTSLANWGTRISLVRP